MLAVMISGVAAVAHPQARVVTSPVARVDHLVYAAPDLQAGIDEIERLLGVRATIGGRHPGAGTRNALVSLGPTAYLEIIAPDPEQATYQTPRMFGIDELTTPRLATWAANGTNLNRLAEYDLGGGARLGAVAPGSRRTPQGDMLSWHYTNPRTVLANGVVPFFIDWGTSPHPARTAAQGATLVGLRAEHPDPEEVQQILGKLGVDLPVRKGQRPALIATIICPRGRVELR